MSGGPIIKGPAWWFKGGVRGRTITVPSAAATVTIKPGQSGSTFLHDRASGVAYTLPTPYVGLNYYFLTTVLQTSGTASVHVDASSTAIMIGAVEMFSGNDVTPSSTLGPFAFTAPAASSFVQIRHNGTTTGGGIGSLFNVLCVTAGASPLWMVTGDLMSPSGSLATPFST